MFAPVTGEARNSASTPRASIRIDGFLRTFLYHCVSGPCTGSRKSLSTSSTNQTGIEIVFPDFLPITLSLTWRWRARRSQRYLSVILHLRSPNSRSFLKRIARPATAVGVQHGKYAANKRLVVRASTTGAAARFAGLHLETLFAAPKPFTALWHYTPAFCGQRPLASDPFPLTLDSTPDCMIWSRQLITKLRAR